MLSYHSIAQRALRQPLAALLFLCCFVLLPFYLYAQSPSAPVGTAPAGQQPPSPPAVQAQPQPAPQFQRPVQSQPRPRRLRPEDVAGENEEEESENPPPVQTPVPQVPRAQTGRPPGQASLSPAGGQFSFNFDDADIFSVIQTIFGDVLKVNYVIDPRVKGRVTFRSVAPVPKENVLPLMEVIMRLNGVAVVEESGLYRIIPLNELAREPSPVGLGRDAEKVVLTGKALLQVIPINYMSSTEMVKLVTPFLSANAVVVDVPKINHIIVVDTDASVKRILSLVDIFDSEQQKKKRPQVFVYSVQNGKSKDITALLQQVFLGARPAMGTTTTTTTTSPGMTSPTSQPAFPATPTTLAQPQISGLPGTGSALISPEITRIFSNDVTNSIMVLATPEDYQIIKETIEKIDMVPRQVVIEALIAQITLTDNLSLGVAWAMKTNIGGTMSGLISSAGDSIAAITDPTKPSGAGFTFIGTDDRGLVRALVTALASESKGKVLASPHILVADNREARIQVGQQVPLITAETFGTPGVAPVQVVQYRDIGIILKVKPQINASGLVALEMSQEVSTFTTTTLFSGSTQIILNKTEATSALVVQDGQTIVIGGLIREDPTTSLSGIPYLSKIPVLGYFFGNRSRTVTRTELIILLKPRVIRNVQDATGATSDFVDNFTKRGNVTKEDLHWIRPPQDQSTPTLEKDSTEEGK
jgi:type II secretory pathway component GspD/PulD (secretin)